MPNTIRQKLYAEYLKKVQVIMRKGVGKKPADPHYENSAERELAQGKKKSAK